MKKPRRRGDLGLLRVPLRGNLTMMGREKPHHCETDSTPPVQGNPSEYELFVINRIDWSSKPKGDACRAFATATPLPSCRSLSASITTFVTDPFHGAKECARCSTQLPSGWISDAWGGGGVIVGLVKPDANAPK